MKFPVSGLNNVDVVSADQPRGFISIIEMPAVEAEVVGGQQAALNLRGKSEIVFERPPFVLIQMVEAEALQWIADEPIGLYGVVANFTQTIRTRFEPFERRIHLSQQSRQLRVGTSPTSRGQRRLYPRTALKQLFPHCEIEINAHKTSFWAESSNSMSPEGRIRSRLKNRFKI